jgi:hypothetical protein
MGSDYPNNKSITNICKWISVKNIGISWPKIISNTELWEAAGETPVILEIRTIKLGTINHPLRKGDESMETSIWLEFAGSQKESKTEASLKKDRYGKSRKMRQNME